MLLLVRDKNQGKNYIYILLGSHLIKYSSPRQVVRFMQTLPLKATNESIPLAMISENFSLYFKPSIIPLSKKSNRRAKIKNPS